MSGLNNVNEGRCHANSRSKSQELVRPGPQTLLYHKGLERGRTPKRQNTRISFTQRERDEVKKRGLTHTHYLLYLVLLDSDLFTDENKF